MWVWAGIIAFVVAAGGIGYAIYHAMNPGPNPNIVVDNAGSTNNPGLSQNTGTPSGNTPANEPQSAPGQVTATTQPTSTSIPQSSDIKTALVVLRSDLTEEINKESTNLSNQQAKEKELAAEHQRKEKELNQKIALYKSDQQALSQRSEKPDELKRIKKEYDGLPEQEKKLSDEIQRIEFERQTNNAAQDGGSHLAELQAMVKNQGALANNEITKKLKNIFRCPADGQFYFQVADLQITNAPSPGSKSGSFNVQTKDADFKISVDSANGYISLTKIDVLQNNLKNPLLVMFSTSEEPKPSDNSMAKLVIWPRNERIDANCDTGGNLHINNAKLLALLNEVKGSYKNNIYLKIQYADGLGQGSFACQTNFELSSVLDYSFTGLPERLKSWNQQLKAIQTFEDLRNKIIGFSETNTTIWGEVDDIYRQLTSFAEPFYFQTNYVSAAEYIVDTELVKEYEKHSDSAATNLFIQALAKPNLESLNQFISSEPKWLRLSEARGRLQNLLPNSKEPLRKKLFSRVIIIYEDGEETLGRLNFN